MEMFKPTSLEIMTKYHSPIRVTNFRKVERLNIVYRRDFPKDLTPHSTESSPAPNPAIEIVKP
jgi:hypothetical protein